MCRYSLSFLFFFSRQFDSNTLIENTYSDIYSYYGAAEEVAEVEPFTGINVNNVYR